MSMPTANRPVPVSVPTATGLLISTEMDALRLFEAARLYPNHFPMVTTRIEDWKVRLQLFVHGSVFIFQRRQDFARWTDGKRWMPNQQTGPFLCYEEACRRQIPENNYRAGLNRGERGYIRPDLERKEGGLQKWTYTVQVVPDPRKPQERVVWEMVWYLQPELFTPRGHNLMPVSRHDFLRKINVPHHLYFWEGALPLPRQTSNIVRIPESGLLRSQAPPFQAVGPSINRPMSVPPRAFGGHRPSLSQSDSSDDMTPSPRARVQLPPFSALASPGRRIVYDHARLPSFPEFLARTRELDE